MRLTPIFWWTMILSTVVSTVYLVVNDQWLAGAVWYTIGFFVAVALSNWRSTVESDKRGHDDK